MTMNPLPPQAYTKETLLKAYSWLMSQSPSIKEMATTPDILVSLYLKATRDGDSALERPSIKNFKSELKNLAGLMGELDKAPSIPSTLPMPVIQEETPVPMNPTTSPLMAATATTTTTTTTATLTKAAPNPYHSTSIEVDTQSLLLIREVKEELNLSCENEALRLIIKVGATRAKNLLK